MTRILAAIAVAVLAAAVHANPYPDMHPKGMRVGNVGDFKQWEWTVAEKIDDRTAVVYISTFPELPVLVKGFDGFKDVADGSELRIPGRWKVTGTEKRGGRTLFVVGPLPAPAGKR
jgi:hypothetical protein